jgi:hypothetical protein
MIVPDFSSAYSALDAMPSPLATLDEICAFMREAGEPCEEQSVYWALQEYRWQGAVVALVLPDRPPRYALRRRLAFVRRLRLLPDPWLPWGA